MTYIIKMIITNKLNNGEKEKKKKVLTLIFDFFSLFLILNY